MESASHQTSGQSASHGEAAAPRPAQHSDVSPPEERGSGTPVVQSGAGQATRTGDKEPLWKKLLLGAVGALIAAVIGRAVGIIPNPFEHGQRPRGSVTVEQTIPNVTLAAFNGKQRAQQGNDVDGVQLNLDRSSQHTSAHGCKIVWSYWDMAGPTQLSSDRAATHVKDGDGTACQGHAQIWVPYISKLEGLSVVKVRVEFFDGDHQQLGSEQWSDPLHP